jgi:hypothetical protein
VYVVHPITKLESAPLPPEPQEGDPADPPAPITTAPKAVPPETGISVRHLTPPAPPPPPTIPPPPPPPATTIALTNLVPDCVVTILGVLAVFDVTVFLPKEITLNGPIIPPFAIANYLPNLIFLRKKL